ACNLHTYPTRPSSDLVDKFAPSTTECRGSAGQCDVAENCTGTSGACPADGFASNTTTCTGTSQGGVCNVQDYCLGTANTCVDKFAPSTTECRGSACHCDGEEDCRELYGTFPADG